MPFHRSLVVHCEIQTLFAKAKINASFYHIFGDLTRVVEVIGWGQYFWCIVHERIFLEGIMENQKIALISEEQEERTIEIAYTLGVRVEKLGRISSEGSPKFRPMLQAVLSGYIVPRKETQGECIQKFGLEPNFFDSLGEVPVYEGLPTNPLLDDAIDKATRIGFSGLTKLIRDGKVAPSRFGHLHIQAGIKLLLEG